MKRFRQSRSVLFAALAIAVLVSTCATALAGDIEDKDFSLRFPAALTRFATYGDVSGVGGASAGSKWSSSTNPASLAWLANPPRKLSLSPQYSMLDFKNGTRLNVLSESVTVDTGVPGYFSVSAAQVSSNRETLRDGMGFRFASDVAQVLWGKKLSEDWAVGAGFTYSKALSRMYYGDMEVAKSNCDSYDVRAGALRKLGEHWLAGLVVDYGWSSDRTDMFPGLRICDSTRQVLVRPGVSYEYMKNGTVYLDYQYAGFFNETGHLNLHRICAGVEHGFTDWFFVRAGTTFDPSIHDVAWTCGVGIYPAPWLSIDVAYQYDMFPEIQKEFGRANTFTVSVSFTF